MRYFICRIVNKKITMIATNTCRTWGLLMARRGVFFFSTITIRPRRKVIIPAMGDIPMSHYPISESTLIEMNSADGVTAL
jgi:hypothetical protein